ncbi:MAG: hypothetical protein FWD21_04475 [Peptococcaceae bacterium]|nr:hypothetical protein [Peptococcaceae bacterium]
MSSVGSVKAYMGNRQIRLEKNVQANILRQIVDQADKSPDEVQDSSLNKSRSNPPYLGNNIDVYV